MNFLSSVSTKFWKRCAFLLLLAAAGCHKDEIRVYDAPKDTPPQAMADATGEQPGRLGYVLPEGWKELTPEGMAVLKLAVPGPDGGGEVSALQFPARGIPTLELINVVRENMKLKEMTQEELNHTMEPVAVGSEQGSLIDLNRAINSSATNNVRALLAVYSHGDTTWFFKLDGSPETVTAQKPAFLEFLKSVQMPQGTAATSAPPAETAEKFNWKVPADWKQGRAGQMQVARFSVPGNAEVFVSVFPSDTGGTLLNVNRWRKQLDLPPTTEADLSTMVSPLDPSESQAILVDMANNNRRLIGAIVPRDGRYWFYKLLGDASSVGPQKNAFVAFAKSKP